MTHMSRALSDIQGDGKSFERADIWTERQTYGKAIKSL